MPKRDYTKRLGRGITERTSQRTEYDLTQPLSKDETAELINAFASMRPTSRIDKARRLAEATLLSIEQGNTSPDDFEPHIGLGWYSQEIIKRCDWILKAKDRGDDASRIAELGFEIGELLTEGSINFEWGNDAVRGRKVGEAAKAGGDSRAAMNMARDNAIRHEFAAKCERMDPATAKNAIARQEGLNVRTVRRILTKNTDAPGQVSE
jgi:hypothetical protein